MQRFDVHFHGRVQGVGFRATACDIARDYAVAGQVRNLPDGRVQLTIEGEKDQLQAYINAILKRMNGYITRHTIDRTPATGNLGEPGFGQVVTAY